MQVPLTSTASHGMMVPLLGMTITSPGTRSVDKISSISARKGGCNGGVKMVNVCINYRQVESSGGNKTKKKSKVGIGERWKVCKWANGSRWWRGRGWERRYFVCQSPRVLLSTSLITHASLASRKKKAEASQVGASAVDECINKNIRGAPSSTTMLLTDSEQEFHFVLCC